MALTEERGVQLAARRAARLPGAPVVLAGAVGVGLAVLGSLLLTPGGSLAVPALVVGLVGIVTAIGCWVAFGTRRQSMRFVVSCLAFTLGAGIWTFFLALPASLLGSATAQAQDGIMTLTTHSLRVAPARCNVVESGSMGLLDAPFRVCGFSPGPGFSPFLVYTSLRGGADSGLGFTPHGDITFPDECSRHLVGPWWAWSRSTGGLGGCRVGYTFHGGG